jgi:bifunctional DNA-binding transcriptional regulator/antitoxin component of YhaV-PrlF toxin-antitoxin module
MKTSLSNKGRIVLPTKLRRQDRLRPGQQFEIERLQRGRYLLQAIAPRKSGLLRWLMSFPEKDWFRPLSSESTTEL